jgi:hypothetical protein
MSIFSATTEEEFTGFLVRREKTCKDEKSGSTLEPRNDLRLGESTWEMEIDSNGGRGQGFLGKEGEDLPYQKEESAVRTAADFVTKGCAGCAFDL